MLCKKVFKSLKSGNLESCLFSVLVLEHRVDRENPDEAVPTTKPLDVKAIFSRFIVNTA